MLDLSKSNFLSFNNTSQTLLVTSTSLADIGEYSYQILYQLEDFPQVKLVVPLGITIQSPRVSQILISPQPASTYTLSAGTDLILSFEVTNPNINDILIEVDTGKADSFTKVEIQQQGS